MAATTNQAGTVLTCSNDDCGCRLRIEEPCPHGDEYRCACGHPFVDAGSGDGGLAQAPA
jgi:metallothionein